MATLVLGAVGSAVGGPLGGALGALLGQSLDQGFLASGRRGPRLGDLSVQTSSYGKAIPRIFGTMRAAGTIVWSTDIQERAADTGGYSYSANFAVALSSRPIKRIGRIWAEGSLLRGSEGDFKVRTDFRLYRGLEDQAVDPLIAAIEGKDRAPAFRGMAVAVFENLELATFGNRIPSLTFEIVADDGGVSVEDLLQETRLRASAADATLPVTGFAVHGDDLAAALTPLLETCGVELISVGGAIQGIQEGAPRPLLLEELGCSFDAGRVPTREISAGADADALRAVALTYYDAARDYQVGQSRLMVEGAGQRELRLELPAVVETDTAKALTEQMLVRHWRERQRMTVRLPPDYADLLPGEKVQIPGERTAWRVVRCTFEGFVVTAELVQDGPGHGSVGPADAGRAIAQADVRAEPTSVQLFELPDSVSVASGRIQVYAAVAGGSTPWRPIKLEVDTDGEILTQLSASKKAIVGVALGSLGASSSALFDQSNEIIVQVGDSDWLQSCDDLALVSGRNLALLGEEIIQFGDVIPLGAGRFRLRRLLRGRQGTEHACGAHAPGERFVLLDLHTLAQFDVPATRIGASIRVAGQGLADVSGHWVDHIVAGLSLRPPSPVHLRSERLPDGAVQIRWVRRSRQGWSWLDEVDAPLAEGAERYRVRLQGSQSEQVFEVGEPALFVLPADVQRLGAGPLACSVQQVGDGAISEPAVATLIL